MLCSNCKKLAVTPKQRHCLQCSKDTYYKQYVICEECSKENNKCIICLKSINVIKHNNIPFSSTSRCKGCGK